AALALYGWLAGTGVSQAVPLAGVVGAAAGALFLGFLAAEEPLLAAGAAVAFVSAFATLDVSFERAFILAHAALNVVFLAVAALDSSTGKRFADKLFDSFAPASERLGVPPPTRSMLAHAGSALAYLGLAVLVAISLGRLIAFSPLFLSPDWAPYMALAQLVTAGHQLRRRPRADSWHALLIGVIASVWLLGGAPLWPYVAGALATVFALLSFAVSRAAGRSVLGWLTPGMSELEALSLGKIVHGYSTLAALLGMAITQADPRTIDTPVAFALGTLAFGVQAALGSGSGRVLFLLAVPATVHLTAFHVGIRLATGRPQEAILPALAASMALAALLSERVGSWRKGRGHLGTGILAGHLYGALAALEWAAGLALVQFHTSDLAFSFVAGATLTLLWCIRAQASGSALPAWLAQLAFLTLYASVRLQTDWLGPRGQRGDGDSLATLVLGVLFLGLHTVVKRLDAPAFRQPTRFAALALPVVSALLLAREATYGASLMLLGIALHLTCLAWVEGRGRISGLLAAVAFNLAISVLWLKHGIGGDRDLQYYVIPVGLTLVALSQIYRGSLGPAWQARLRTLGILAIYLTSSWPALSSLGSTVHLLWCVGLCVVGMLVGVAFRVRAYLYLGMAFMVTSLLGNMIRHGIDNHRLGAVFLTAMGALLIGGMVFFSAKREQVLERYRKYRTLLASWE
ncbi:MAG: hypothetical protein HY901_37340, partial [Deltaproteobacteria bacterium]|nr:hypothetical protein [Deltaproteobacteria bacterium]